MIVGRCAGCKFLRKKCPSDCIFAPYFPSNNPQRFAFVHRIYGASNVGKMLQQLPVNLRGQAAETLYFEAHSRIQDPVYGCVGIISTLNQQIKDAESELVQVKAQMSLLDNSYSLNFSSDQTDDNNLLTGENGGGGGLAFWPAYSSATFQ